MWDGGHRAHFRVGRWPRCISCLNWFEFICLNSFDLEARGAFMNNNTCRAIAHCTHACLFCIGLSRSALLERSMGVFVGIPQRAGLELGRMFVICLHHASHLLLLTESTPYALCFCAWHVRSMLCHTHGVCLPTGESSIPSRLLLLTIAPSIGRQ